jgi:transcriptional regulator with XRE-family HTH domain
VGMPNTTLKAARTSRRMSQDDLARAIRDAGKRLGEPNGCSKKVIQRWESGAVTNPRGPYLRALEYAMGETAGNLGFADERYGLDREQAMTLPEPRQEPRAETATGPLTGIWLSRYEYESSGRSETFTDQHYVRIMHTGNAIAVQSLPGTAPGSLIMDFTQNGAVLTGTWTERTNPGGYYQGGVYHGAIQVLLEPSGRRMAGKWVGFGRDWDVNVGPWSLALVTHDTSPETIERYNRPVEDTSETGLPPKRPAQGDGSARAGLSHPIRLDRTGDLMATLEQQLHELRAEVAELRRAIVFTTALGDEIDRRAYQAGRESVLGHKATGPRGRPSHLHLVEPPPDAPSSSRRTGVP